VSFAAAEWLWLLALSPVLAAILALAGWMHRRALRRVFSTQLLERVVPGSVRARRTVRDLATLLGLMLLVVALGEPRFDKAVRTLNLRGTDIVVILDLSRSMDARDVDPSRLERARREIADLGRVVEGDRVGLVVFAGGAYPRLPLTADYKAIDLVVSEVRTDAFDTQGSDLGSALRVALEMLDRSRQEAGQAVLVLSDGEIHDGDDALAAADEAATRGVPIFVMGIGIEAAPIPLSDGRFLTWQGETVTTVPDFEILEQAAKRTGGAFVSSNAGSRDMEQLYAELRRSVQAADRSTQRRETWRSAFQVPLGLATALLMLAAWLGEGRRRFGAAAAVVLALGLASPTVARAADPLQEADQLYRDGKLPQAIDRLVELSLERPEDPDVLERLGAARYRTGDYEGAARAYDQAVRLRGDPGSDAAYNAGNADYLAGKLEDALDRYQRVLEARPDHDGARHNQELVTKEIAARRAMQPPPPPPPQGGGEDQEEESQGDQQEQQESPGDPKEQEPKPGGSPKPSDEQQEEQGEPEQGQGKSDGRQEDQQNPSGDQLGTEQGGQESDASADPQAGEIRGEQEGPITEGQAHRLLDSIEEGSQRMVVQGRPDDKPW
jgi:Ca-activated chloride channel homolog